MEWMGCLGSLDICMLQKAKHNKIEVLIHHIKNIINESLKQMYLKYLVLY